MAAADLLFESAQQIIPGGVNSPVRAFRAVGGDPVFFESGHGAYMVDNHGKEYIDYVCSWGPLIAGHCNPYVAEKVIEVVNRGWTFGAATEIEVHTARKVREIMPNMEMMRFVNSGTEATMSAIRLARGFTGRDKIIKFSGCYHGHADSLLVAGGSGLLTFGVPNSAGVPASFAEHTLIADYNNLEQVAKLFEEYPEQIACIILEPVAGNMNCVPPQPGFLEGLRKLCDDNNSVLIMDEVMTGFRVALGGAQAYYDVKPDLTTLGKVIGGGFPVGAFGGRKDIMEFISPLGPVYQAGTLSGNPGAMAAGLATLELVSEPGFHANLTKFTTELMAGIKERADAANIPLHTVTVGGMFGIFFTDEEKIIDEAGAKRCKIEQFKRFFHGMLQEGVYMAPSAFEAGFTSSAHGAKEMQHTLDAAEKVFASIA